MGGFRVFFSKFGPHGLYITLGSGLDKLLAPEGHPGSGLVPGVMEGRRGRKAGNEGDSAGRRQSAGGRKAARREQEPRVTCLNGTQFSGFKSPKTEKNRPDCVENCVWN